MSDQAGMKPGDEAPEGTPDTGDAVCPACSGSGRIDGSTCSTCAGSGIVTEGIGGG
jgi:hypothetical protein